MMKAGSKSLLFFVFVLLQTVGHTQSFAWKAKLDTVSQTGFYRIPLSLDWLWRVRGDLSDIRIQNEQRLAVPFLIRPMQSNDGAEFVDFPILVNTTDTSVTTMELNAGKWQGTNRIDLVMGNTAVERRALLSGSDDRIHWFIIDENLQLTNAARNTNGRFVQSLQFPFVQYHYLKLQIRNNGTDPLPVIKAGLFVDTTSKAIPEMDIDPGTTYQQVDSSNGYSYVWVHNQHPYPVGKIYLQLSGDKFYQRKVEVYKMEKGKAGELLTAAELRFGREPAIWVPTIKVEDLVIKIANGDNPPLRIASVNTFSSQQQLIAYLEKGRQYVLVGGNNNSTAPQYDLARFRDSIPYALPTLGQKEIQANKATATASTITRRWWIWPVLVLMLTLLTAVTLRMVREAKNMET